MKALIVAVCCLGASFAHAKVYTPPSLQESAYLDTTVSTNFTCRFGTDPIQFYRAELRFFASVSNCVEMAFGVDADGDGRLGPTEAEVSFGWDCGRWVVRGRDEAFSRVCGEDVLETEVEATWTVDVGRGRAKKCHIEIEGEALEWSRPGAVLPPWLFNPEWNLARITVRGVERAQEHIRLELKSNGFVFSLK